jgi:hypothetical protein
MRSIGFFSLHALDRLDAGSHEGCPNIAPCPRGQPSFNITADAGRKKAKKAGKYPVVFNPSSSVAGESAVKKVPPPRFVTRIRLVGKVRLRAVRPWPTLDTPVKGSHRMAMITQLQNGLRVRLLLDSPVSICWMPPIPFRHSHTTGTEPRTFKPWELMWWYRHQIRSGNRASQKIE